MFLKNIIVGVVLLSASQASERYSHNPYNPNFLEDNLTHHHLNPNDANAITVVSGKKQPPNKKF